MTVDTLIVDHAYLSEWQQQAEYAYDRELVTPEFNFWEWLWIRFGDWLDWFFQMDPSSGISYYVKLGCILLFVCLLGFVVYKLNPRLFIGQEKVSSSYSVEDDNIEGIDFEADIAQALQSGAYREAMRLLYLQTLKRLRDEGRIDWQLRKTPLQYTYECTYPSFRLMTRAFMGVRYANETADASRFDEMRELQGALMTALSEKGGTS